MVARMAFYQVVDSFYPFKKKKNFNTFKCTSMEALTPYRTLHDHLPFLHLISVPHYPFLLHLNHILQLFLYDQHACLILR